MSRTRRFNQKKTEPKRGDFVIWGHTVSMNEPETWKDTRDHKPWGGPPKWYKTIKKRRRRAQERNAFRHFDPDGSVIPEHPKTDRWDWS